MKRIRPEFFAIAERIRATRARVGLSRTAYAARVGVNYKSLENWERGCYAPNGLALLRIMADAWDLWTPGKTGSEGR